MVLFVMVSNEPSQWQVTGEGTQERAQMWPEALYPQFSLKWAPELHREMLTLARN